MYYDKEERYADVALPQMDAVPHFGSQLTLVVVSYFYLFIATTVYDLSSDLRFRGSLKKPQLALLCVRPPVSICADEADDIFRGVLQHFIYVLFIPEQHNIDNEMNIKGQNKARGL